MVAKLLLLLATVLLRRRIILLEPSTADGVQGGVLGEGSARLARVDASAGLLAVRSRAGIVSGVWMRPALLLQLVDVNDGGYGVGISSSTSMILGVFYSCSSTSSVTASPVR